ncbi:helix-turn-helix transcriptional regulator [Comamonas sediminis]|uniref:helix-turn-helix transcriptional regulator n=1 Tax=Comamonas sediminis TaxID=1783360 RepID=UPI003D2696CC
MPRQNTPPSDHPEIVLQQIKQLALNIAIARKRRGESQAQWAMRLGVSQPTMARIERGDPSVAMASYVMCIWLINPRSSLAELIAPQNDHGALEKEIARVRSKRSPGKQSNAYAVSADNAPPEERLPNQTGPAISPLEKMLSTQAGPTFTSTHPGIAALLNKSGSKET